MNIIPIDEIDDIVFVNQSNFFQASYKYTR
jgi:hypothetical protein